jgi:hypothetical protein
MRLRPIRLNRERGFRPRALYCLNLRQLPPRPPGVRRQAGIGYACNTIGAGASGFAHHDLPDLLQGNLIAFGLSSAINSALADQAAMRGFISPRF